MEHINMLTGFIEALEMEEKSENTINKYARDVSMLLKDIDGISKESILNFKKNLIQSGYAISSINSMIASVNKFLRWIGRDECCVKSFKIQHRSYAKEDKLLTKGEYIRLLESSENDEKTNLIMQTICGSGIRVSELKYFTVEAVAHGEIEINLKGKTRTILITGKLKKKLLRYANKNSITSGCIFVNRKGEPIHRSYVWALMKRICEKANVKKEKVFPHNLRKLFARSFYKIERDISKLADILGHSNINTTRIYIATSCKEHIRQLEMLNLVI